MVQPESWSDHRRLSSESVCWPGINPRVCAPGIPLTWLNDRLYGIVLVMLVSVSFRTALERRSIEFDQVFEAFWRSAIIKYATGIAMTESRGQNHEAIAMRRSRLLLARKIVLSGHHR